jgi:hypothetical protein
MKDRRLAADSSCNAGNTRLSHPIHDSIGDGNHGTRVRVFCDTSKNKMTLQIRVRLSPPFMVRRSPVAAEMRKTRARANRVMRDTKTKNLPNSLCDEFKTKSTTRGCASAWLPNTKQISKDDA